MPADQKTCSPLLQPLAISHGTLACRSFADSRPLYEEFLGLECVQHEDKAMLLTIGRKFVIVAIEAGESAKGVDVLRHWGIDVGSREEVVRMHKLALQQREKYGIRKVFNVRELHGAYSFYFQDRDGNWWEIQHVGIEGHDHVFQQSEYRKE